ncbi:MAG: hypothetical protein N2200_00005, partial [Bacteroidia bacterium]|nr:hypothetical protein [Bacteroidia bacterium]
MSQAKSIDMDYAAYEMRDIMLRSRVVAWLVLASYYATLGMAYIFDLSPEVRRFYLWIYGVGSVTPLTVCIALRISKSLIWRFSLPIVATTPVLAEAAFFQPLNGAVFWWSVFVAGYAAILFLNKEERAAVFALPIIVGLGGGVVLLLHPKIASLPANPVSHGVFRYSVLQIAMIVGAIVGLLQYDYIRQWLLNREMQLSDALARQEEANAQLLAEKQLSEQRRQQVEAALV